MSDDGLALRQLIVKNVHNEVVVPTHVLTHTLILHSLKPSVALHKRSDVGRTCRGQMLQENLFVFRQGLPARDGPLFSLRQDLLKFFLIHRTALVKVPARKSTRLN